MIPVRIFVAAIATLLIICDKMATMYIDRPKSYVYEVFLIDCYILAGYYWPSSIFLDNYNWYSYAIGGIFGLLAFIYCYFTYFYEKEKKASVADFNLIGKHGIIEGEYGNGSYAGRLDTGEPILVYCKSEITPTDSFSITEITEGKIFVDKS